MPTHEALTYIALLTHPHITASVLCKETSIPDSKIYYALDGLSKKGMLIVQKGNPNTYLPISPKEAIANLKHRLTEIHNEKTREAEVLADMLTPLYESAERPGELEVAYIIKGQRNIINRMKSLIETARKEVTVFISNQTVFNELKESLAKARDERGVRLNIALTKELVEKEGSSDLGETRLLCCPVGMLVSDMKGLLTVSDWIDETAMMTQDQNLIRVARDSYDNPRVARAGKSQKKGDTHEPS